MQTLSSVYGASTPMMNPQLQTLQWLCSLSPHQQALLLPLLSQNTPLSSPMFVPSKEEEMMAAGMNRESLFSLNHLQQSPLSYCLHDNQMTESTQENSPKIAYYNYGLGMNDCFSLQDKPIYATSSMLNNNLPNMSLIASSKKIKKQKNQNNSAKKCDTVLTNIRKESCDSVMSGLKSPTLSAMKQNSNSNNMNLLGDDKNIIHINFTKNLLKSFRRYCEYFHKNNQQLLQQIKTEFETNHMNNQLLVHFMTNPLTQEYFQLFVDGPAQKWVKEQSRLKKQDQQLELIEICRQRLFEKIKVKKYCDSVTNTMQVEDNNQVSQSPNLTPLAAPVMPATTKKTNSLTARPIFSSVQQQTSTARKSALSSSSSSSSSSCAGSDDSYGEEMNHQKNNQSSKNHRKEECDLEEEDDDSSQSRQINRNLNTLNNKNNNKQINNFPQVTFEAKIEEIEQAIKIEDDN